MLVALAVIAIVTLTATGITNHHASSTKIIATHGGANSSSYAGDFTLTDSQVNSQKIMQDIKLDIAKAEKSIGATIDQQIAGKEIGQLPSSISKAKADAIIENNPAALTNIPSDLRKDIAALVQSSLQDAANAVKTNREPLTNTTTSSKVKAYFHNDFPVALHIFIIYQLLLNGSRGLAESYRALTFANLVKPGGSWDIKQWLGYNTRYILYGRNISGDDVGNAHYAYMGKVIGYSNVMLHTAGGIVQIATGRSNLDWLHTYFDEPSDYAAIDYGISLYNSGVSF